MEPLTILLIIVGAFVVLAAILFLLDVFFAGGSMTMGMMHGTVFLLSNPIGWAILLVLLAILGVLVYAVFSL